MTIHSILSFSIRALAALGSVVLIGLTSTVVREAVGDFVYVANAVLLLYGGAALGSHLVRLVLGQKQGAGARS
jgi:hypothetical protein